MSKKQNNIRAVIQDETCFGLFLDKACLNDDFSTEFDNRIDNVYVVNKMDSKITTKVIDLYKDQKLTFNNLSKAFSSQKLQFSQEHVAMCAGPEVYALVQANLRPLS